MGTYGTITGTVTINNDQVDKLNSIITDIYKHHGYELEEQPPIGEIHLARRVASLIISDYQFSYDAPHPHNHKKLILHIEADGKLFYEDYELAYAALTTVQAEGDLYIEVEGEHYKLVFQPGHDWQEYPGRIIYADEQGY